MEAHAPSLPLCLAHLHVEDAWLPGVAVTLRGPGEGCGSAPAAHDGRPLTVRSLHRTSLACLNKAYSSNFSSLESVSGRLSVASLAAASKSCALQEQRGRALA